MDFFICLMSHLTGSSGLDEGSWNFDLQPLFHKKFYDLDIKVYEKGIQIVSIKNTEF